MTLLFQQYFSSLHPLLMVIDFCVVYVLIYRALLWMQNSQAKSVSRGLLLVLLIYAASHLLGLETLKWVLNKFATVLLILLIILFQKELRRFLERVGQGQLFSFFSRAQLAQSTVAIQHLNKCIDLLAAKKIGALIAIQVNSSLDQYIESGVVVNGKLSSDLLATLFWPGSPTHDGAVIIQGTTVAAAGCLLPLTDTPLPDRRLGTRHRAALALSELSDALIIVVSEETGVISIAENGSLTRYLKREDVEARLFGLITDDHEDETRDRWWSQLVFQAFRN